MMLMNFVVVLSILTLQTCLGVVNKEVQRREASIADTYGPPQLPNPGAPHPVYGVPGPVVKYPPPPPDIPPLPPVPHKEYGVPQQQQVPHREYGVPILKYGPPKINIEYGPPLFKNIPAKNGGGLFSTLQSAKSSFYDQIKSHFGLPKPSYGPPHLGSRPNAIPLRQYGPPAPVYGPPAPVYGPPPKQGYLPPPGPVTTTTLVQQPAPVYGPPAPVYGPPQLPNVKPQLPAPVYGPPPNLSGSFGAGSSFQGNIQALPLKQVQVFESNHHGGPHHVPTVSCDGWKPIPGPVGHNLNYDHSSASHQSVSSLGQQYHHGNLGLTDDQLIAVALQAGLTDGPRQPQQLLPDHGPVGGFHSSFVGGKDLNGFKSQNVEINHNSISDSYSAPPPDSYAPGSVHALKFSGGGSLNSYSPNVGLIPPSGVYGVPPGGSYRGFAVNQFSSSGAASGHQGLGIQYGTVSGNLKPWFPKGAPPKRPLAFRPPVPEGLIESIGNSVQHLDQFGVKPQSEPNTYIPPPPAEIPQTLNPPHEHQAHSFAQSENIAFAQALPSIQEPRFNQAQDCGHGPNLLHGSLSFGQGQLNGFGLNTNQLTGYSHQQSGEGLSAEYIAAAVTASDSYGPPPSGNPGDVVGYESKQVTSSVGSQSSDQSSNQEQQDLPGLEGLNVVTAQKSQSVTIPVQGQHGAYQLQFTQAGPITSSTNSHDQADHSQILSEGLLQSILTAIEQPNPQPQVDSIQARVDHKDADEFLNSPEGQKTLAEPNDSNRDNSKQ